MADNTQSARDDFHDAVPSQDAAHAAGAQQASGAGKRDGAATRDDASSSDGVVDKQPPKKKVSKREKVRTHCAKYWMWHLLATIILLAILLPLLFKVIIPAIVQDIVKKQKVPIYGGSLVVLDPNTINISLQTSLDTPLPAKIAPLRLSLYNKNATEYSPFINITLPELSVNHKTNASITNQTVHVLDHDQLVAWFNDVFDNEMVKLSLYGKPDVSLGTLKSHPTLDKTIELQGLNKLHGFGIKDLSLKIPPPKDGKNVKGTLNLPNWSNLTLSFGNITLSLKAAGIELGQVTVYDVDIPPGNNTRNFDGNLNLNTLLSNLSKILEAEKEHLNEGNLQLNTSGIATMVNGKHITFIEEVLNKKTLSFTISIIDLATDLLSAIVGGGDAAGSIIDIVSGVFGNSTLIGDVLGHWNGTQHNGTNALNQLAGLKKRSNNNNLGGSFLWKMMKLGLKAKRSQQRF